MLFAMLHARGWLRALGRPQSMPPGQRRLLVLLGAAFVLNSYDFGILALALPQIQADLGVPEAEASRLVAVAGSASCRRSSWRWSRTGAAAAACSSSP